MKNISSEAQEVSFAQGQNVAVCASTNATAFCVTSRDNATDVAKKKTLDPGESMTLTLRFEPDVADVPESGTLQLRTCDACRVHDVRVAGTGVDQAFSCEPNPLAFGAVNPGTCVRRTVTCRNISNLPANLLGWVLDQRSSPEFFVVTGGRVVEVPADGVQDIDLELCPSDLGDRVGTLLIETDAPRQSAKFVSVPLAGSGGGPTLEVTPETLEFGLVATLVPSTRSLLVSNTGFDDLSITDIVVFGDDADKFAVTNTPALLMPGEAAIVGVLFSPDAEATMNATVVIRSNDPARPEVTVTLSGTGTNVPPCAHRITPPELRFGITEIGRSRTRGVVFENIGSANCLVYDAVFDVGTDPEFTRGAPPTRLVTPGGAALIEVEYAPSAAGTNTGSLVVNFSSPTSPTTVPLTGSSGNLELLIFPDTIEFGAVNVMCSSRRQRVDVYNVGATPIPVGAVDLSPLNGPFSIVRDSGSMPPAGQTLQSGESAYFFVEFRPDAERAYAGTVIVPFLEGGTPREHVVSLTGLGGVDAVQTDTFTQLGNPQADILFLVDNSCSMSGEQASLSMNFAAFIQYAVAEGIDYHISAVTLDNAVPGFGRFQPLNGTPAEKVITPSTANAAMAFATNVNVGAVGPGPEMGLEAGYVALSNPLYAMNHSNFLRPNAFLSIIAVSDQPDLSPQTVDFYYRFFASIKGFRNLNRFTFSAIVGDDPGGCTGPGGQAWAGPRYISMAARTGGVFTSICSSDWARALEDLSQTAFGFRNNFFLSGQPDPQAITVLVDGTMVPQVSNSVTAWQYQAASNAVVFTPFAVPEPGAVVDISYDTICL